MQDFSPLIHLGSLAIYITNFVFYFLVFQVIYGPKIRDFSHQILFFFMLWSILYIKKYHIYDHYKPLLLFFSCIHYYVFSLHAWKRVNSIL